MSNPPTPPFTPKPRLKLLPDWVRLPGTARLYHNVRTGETLSRRQYDNRYGRIARSGFATEYAQKKAEKTKWKGFYVEHFKVRDGAESRAWEQLLARIRELQHRRMFVSAYGEAGVDYPTRAGEQVWVSTQGFYGDAIFARAVTFGDIGPSGISTQTYTTASLWLTDQLFTGALRYGTVTEYVLRWQNETLLGL